MFWQTKKIKVSVGALILTQHHRKRQVTWCVDQAKRPTDQTDKLKTFPHPSNCHSHKRQYETHYNCQPIHR